MSVTLESNWTATRRLLAIAGLATWLPRAPFLEEAYSSAGVVLATGEIPLTAWFVLPPVAAWGVLAALLGGLVFLLWRQSRAVAGLVFVCVFVLVYTEGLNEKAYDRLFLFEVAALVLAGSGRGAWGEGARTALTIVFCGIYASTGWAKLLYGSGWFDGTALGTHLVHVDFGLRPLGLLAAQSQPLLAFMSWWTLLFECLFPVLVFWPRTRGAALVLGAGFHLGVLATMHVNTFSLISMAGYPAMASAEEWAWLRGWLERLRRPIAAVAAAWVLSVLSPFAAQRVVGPWPGAAWTPPDLALQQAVALHVSALAARPPAEVVAEAWGGPERVLGDGPRRVTLLASTDGEGADARTGLAALLALSERWTPRGATVTMRAVSTEGVAPSGDLTVWVGPIGHTGLARGGQGWPGAYGLWLTSRPSFVGVGGSRGFAARWAEVSPVDVMVLPGSWGPEGVVVVTDTGSWRGPRGKRDVVEAVDLDQVARVARALADVVDTN